MKLLSILLFSLLASIGGIGDIAEKNKHKRLATEAYKQENYQEAAKHFRLLDSLSAKKDESVILNLAHCYYKTQEKELAIEQYSRLGGADDHLVKAAAHNQMGVIHLEEKKLKEALDFFKESLKADPTNEYTRYNYELTKKLLEQQQEQEKKQEQNKEQQDQNQDQQEQQEQQQDQKDQEQQDKEQQQQDSQNQDGEGEDEKQKEQEEQQGDKEQDGKDKDGEEDKAKQQKQKQQSRMKEINMSEERAKMLLEAMKNQEVQYYQQLRKKTKPRKNTRGKPDW